MCTVTIIPLASAGFRLVANRDERRERPAALPPRIVRPDGADADALWPVDPTGGGTWIGANVHGLVASTLNLNAAPDPPGPRPTPARSRGAIIPALMAGATCDDAEEILRAMSFDGMLPFRLVVVDGATVRVARWDRRELTIDRTDFAPTCLVSSGLGDALVAPRVPLFERLVLAPGAGAAAQDAYHDHQWPDRPEISVRMERAEARTVSRTIVEVTPSRVVMRYHPMEGAESASELRRSPARTGARA